MKFFVFGSNGMMGKYFCSISENAVQLTRKDYDICDNDINKITKVLKSRDIQDGDILLNFAGAIKQRNFSLSDYVYINSLFPHQLELISKKLNCKLVHLTTDCVYDGGAGPYKEGDPHTCNDWYGNSKSLGETQDSCCIRTSIIGLGSAGNVSLLDWFSKCHDETITGFSNHFWNGLTCLELSKIIIKLIENNSLWRGTRHVFSNTVSKYELLSIYNEIFKIKKKLIKTSSETYCDRSLSSIHNKIITNTIHTQLEELRKYHEQR